MATWKSSSRNKRKTAEPKAGGSLLADLGAPPTSDEFPMMLEAHAHALDALGFELRTVDLAEAAGRTSVRADRVRLSVLQSQKVQPACSKGCSHCCHHKVGVTMPELIAIVVHLEAESERREVVRAKAAELAKNPLIFSDTEKPRARIPCALLDEDGSCGVYEVRPIPCRSWLSWDVQSCKRHLDGEGEPQAIVAAARSGRLIQQALVKVMAEQQRGPHLVELTAGLDIALNVPGAIESWIAGEPVFERASAARR